MDCVIKRHHIGIAALLLERSCALQEEATGVINSIFAKNREMLAAIVADNANPKAQKVIFTWAIKQYALLLENRGVEAGRCVYRAIVTAAVQANPKLYYIARTYCNLLDGFTKVIPGNAVDLIQSYLTIER